MVCVCVCFILTNVAFLLDYDWSCQKINCSTDWIGVIVWMHFPHIAAIHFLLSFPKSSKTFSGNSLEPPVPNEFWLNWSGAHNTTHYMERVFVCCTKTDCKNCLKLYPPCIPSCSCTLSTWRPGWAMGDLRKGTQPNKMIPYRQTARGATFERQGQLMNLCVYMPMYVFERACIQFVTCSCTVSFSSIKDFLLKEYFFRYSLLRWP